MRTSRKLASNLALIGWLALWSAPAGAAPIVTAPTAAQADSLVWYVEQLEADLRLCRVHGGARSDSLALRLEFVSERLAWAEEDRRRWYQDPRLWFLAGAAASVFVLSWSLQLSF